MKKIQLILGLLIFFFSEGAFAQNLKEMIIGKWLHKGVREMECPDLIAFHKDGTYQVLNDCYGADKDVPILEKGTWRMDSTASVITLINRKFYSNYYFQNSKKTLLIYFKNVTDQKMSISFRDQAPGFETYEKVK
jgi:hypothetical protein